VRRVLALARTLLFAVLFIAESTVFSFGALFAIPFGKRAVVFNVRCWSAIHRWLCRWVLDQRVHFTAPMPDGPFLYVFKHESMFETIETPILFAHPAVFAKAELFRIPVWGAAALTYGLIPVEREGGGKAMRAMIASARAALDAGRPLCLFPEGTRVWPGQTPPLKPGFAGLYKLLGVPVIPVAVDSGSIYPRGFLKVPGVITYHIGLPIPPGLGRDEIEARVHAGINALNVAARDQKT
jgi:1-acyl-sn-glycerol-3-phosphate acyltransferase